MASSTKIVYEHLKDYPTSTEGYREIKAPAIAAAVYGEHMSGSKGHQGTASTGGKSAQRD
ncbi:MAG: hypothetical protein R3D62_11275 [Xanthobacteraceae bacterium]